MPHAVQLIRCHIGSEAYCFEMSSVVGVYPAVTLRKGPQSAPIGWVASPGDEDVPVFRLADRLGRTAIADVRHQHILVVHSSLGTQGFLVDAVSRMIPVPAEHVRAVPTLLNDPARRLFKSVVLFREDGRSDSLGLVLSAERLHQHAVPLTADVSSSVSCSRRERDAATDVEPAPNPALGKSGLHSAGRIVLFPLSGSAFAGRDVLCGFSAAQVVEIVEPLPVVPVPLAPAQVAGVVLWREQAVPVLRFHEYLGLPAETPTRRMVILRHAGELFALSTAHGLRARRLPLPHRPCVPPSELPADVLWGAFQSESEVLVIPNLTRLTRPQSQGVI
jgi:chemotaxis signal transduction protein